MSICFVLSEIRTRKLSKLQNVQDGAGLPKVLALS